MLNEYSGKVAYDQTIAKNYEKDRIVEDLWEIEQNFIAKYLATLENGSSILDIPVGTGRFFEFYNNFKVTGVDISNEMLKVSQNKVKDNNYSKIELMISDITELKLQSNSVNYSICWRLFHLLPDQIMIQAINELCRVTINEVVIQTYHIYKSTTLNRIKKKIRVLKTKFINQNIQSKQSTEPWSHIPNYPHTEKLILESFEKNGFNLKSNQIIDMYKNNPVNVYVFMQTNLP